MTTTKLFEAMPARLNITAAASLDKTLQWNITGDDPGVWALHIVDGVCRLIPGGVEKPDVTFTLTSHDWLALEEGKLNPMQAFMTGKLKVTGDMALAMRVPQLFPLGK
jgi:putative sterol carrier protein